MKYLLTIKLHWYLDCKPRKHICLVSKIYNHKWSLNEYCMYRFLKLLIIISNKSQNNELKFSFELMLPPSLHDNLQAKRIMTGICWCCTKLCHYQSCYNWKAFCIRVYLFICMIWRLFKRICWMLDHGDVGHPDLYRKSREALLD